MRLKVGDDFLDSDNSIIAQTYAVNEIGNIETSQGGFSNDFTLPLTDNNRSILGFPDDINSSSRNPYTKVEATLVDNGAPIAEGYLKYQIVNDTQLQCSFFADNVNWFNLLKGKSIKDIDYDDLSHDWTFTNANNSIANNEGYIYPLIDYGAFATESSGGQVITIAMENFLPAVFVHTIIERIFFEIGWKIQGEIIDSTIYKRMIIPFSSPAMNHSTQWITDNIYNDTISTPHAVTDVNSSLTFTTAGGTTISWPNDAAKVVVTLTLQITQGIGTLMEVTGSIFGSRNVGPIEIDVLAGTNEYTVTFEKDECGETLNLINTDSWETRVKMVGAGDTATIVATSSIVIEPQPDYLITTPIDLKDTLPNISQSDLLSHVSMSFGGLFQANVFSKTVTWSYFKDIKNNLSTTDDWSNKLDLSKTREVNFTELLNNYGKISRLTFKEASTDSLLVSYESRENKKFGEGSFNIDNEHLPGDVIFYTAPFSSTMVALNTQTSEIRLPIINVYNRTVSDDLCSNIATITRIDPAPRILLVAESSILIADLTKNIYTGISVTGRSSGTMTSCRFSWFEKQTLDIDVIDDDLNTLAFELSNITNGTGTPLKTRFLEPYEAILNLMKYLKAFVHLTEVDISNLDFTIPVYIEQFKSYFYKSKILNYQGRKRTTEAELTKIG